MAARSVSDESEPPPALTAPYTLAASNGGWQIRSASGLGTKGDPIILHGDVMRSSPFGLRLTAIRPINAFQRPETHATGTIHFDLRIRNLSGQPWTGVEFELQEIEGVASVYGDGLSFDQRGVGDLPASSDAFATVRTDFEPYDRVQFQDGDVDPNERVSFQLLVTDLTPADVFWVMIDPQIPAS